MRIIRLENNNDDIINKICEWNYNWWGIKNNNSLEEVRCYFKHSLCKDIRKFNYIYFFVYYNYVLYYHKSRKMTIHKCFFQDNDIRKYKVCDRIRVMTNYVH